MATTVKEILTKPSPEEAKNNWHFFEEFILRTDWLSKEQAEEMLERHQRHFPDVNFSIQQLDNIEGYPRN